MATVESLNIQIAASFRTAASAIDDLNTRLGRTATSLSSIGTRSLNQAFSSSNTSIGKVKKSSESLLSTFTKLYSKIYLLRKGFSMFKNAVQSSMNFVEIYNYFNAAFVQVSSRASNEWQEAGYSSAEAYAKSFRERAEELTTKMTGFQINENGTLENANIQNFGMDPSQLMNYQAMFAQMSSSMGNSSETAVKLSNALTMIGADLASVKNMDFGKVWEDMASGLAGMSRTLDKYGVNIRNVNLQERMHQAGIEGSITNLNQENKALLRAIILLESTEYAWADLGLTLSQPANQMRLMQANFSNLGRTIGNIFLPYVAAAIKYISGFTIALQRLLEPIAAIVAAKFPDFNWGGAKTGSDILSNILDESGEIDDNFDKATKSAKKFQNQLLGFDEVYKLSEPTEDTSSSTGAAGNIDTSLLEAEFDSIYDKYRAVWEEAYKNAENPANEIADRITNAFKSGDYKGIGTYISTNISDALASINWDSVYQGARNFGTGLAQFLNGLITPDLFGNVGKTIAGALNTKLYAALSFGQTFDFTNLGKSIAAGVNNFFATFDFGGLAETLNVWAKGILNTAITALDNINWGMIGEQIGTFLADIDLFEIGVKAGESLWKGINSGVKMWAGSFSKAPFEIAFLSILALPAIVGFGNKLVKLIVTPFKNVWNLLSPVIAPLVSSVGEMFSLWIGGAGTFGESFMAVFGAGGVVVVALAALAAGLGYVFATNEEVRESFNNAISSIKEGLQPALEFFTGTLLPDLQAGWERILEVLSPLGEFLEGMFTSVWQDMINPALTYIGETVLPKVTETFENLWNKVLVPLGSFLADVLEPVIQVVADVLSILWKNRVLPVANVIGNVLSKAFEGLCSVLNNLVIPVVNAIINVFQFLWNNVLSPIVNFIKNVFEPVFESKFEGIKGKIDGLSKAFGGLIDFVTGVFSGEWSRAWEGVKNIFSGIWDTLVSVAKAPLNGVLSLFQGLANGIIDAWNWVKKQLNKVSIDIPDWVPGVGGEKFGFDFDMSSHINIPKLATGAIVYRPTFAEIGEKGKEGVVPLTNPSAMRQLAGEIIAGAGVKGQYGQSFGGDFLQQIEEAACRGMTRAIQAAGGIRAEATFKVEGDPKGMFNVVRNEAFNYARQTYTSPFPT